MYVAVCMVIVRTAVLAVGRVAARASRALAVALSVRSLGKVLSLVGATGSTTISYILPGGIYWRVGPAGPKRYLAAGQFLLGCAIMPAALTFVFLK